MPMTARDFERAVAQRAAADQVAWDEALARVAAAEPERFEAYVRALREAPEDGQPALTPRGEQALRAMVSRRQATRAREEGGGHRRAELDRMSNPELQALVRRIDEAGGPDPARPLTNKRCVEYILEHADELN